MFSITRFLVACAGSMAFALTVHAAGFTLSSPTIKPGSTLTDAQVFNGFGCSGKNISPALSWQGAPAGTKSFAVTLYDPDAPTGSGWWHWVVYNLPATANALPESAGAAGGAGLPAGSAMGRTDFGSAAFGGACPPAGDKPHRYQFTIFAVDIDQLDAEEQSSAAVVGFNLHFHTLARTTLTGLYGR